MSGRFVRASFAVILICGAAVPFVNYGVADAAAFPPPPSSAEWLQAQALSTRQLPGFAVDADYVIPVSEVLPGSGPYYDTVRAGSLRSAYTRDFISFDGASEIKIRLVEYVNHAFALGGLSKSASPLSVEPPLIAPDAVTYRDRSSNGSIQVDTQFVRGRVGAELLINTQKSLDSPAPDLASTLAVLRTSANLEYAHLLDSPDLTARTGISLVSLRSSLYWIVVNAIIVLEIAATLVGALRDRGARERIAHRLFPRTVKRVSGPFPPVVDISAPARRARWRYRAAAVLRNVFFFGLIALTFHLNTVKQITVLGALAFGASVGEILIARIRRRTSFRAAYGRGALLASVGGSTLTIVIGGAAALLILVPLASHQEIPPGATPAQVRSIITTFVIMGLLLIDLADVTYRLSRRLALMSAAKVVDRDQREEILLLRSFLDDRVKIRAHRTGRQSLVERLTLRRRDRFEEIITWALWRFGPVVTLGEPGTRLPAIGAAREYFSNDAWRPAVEEKIASSQLIVMGVGRTRSLVYEVSRIRQAGALSRTLFVFPPVAISEIDVRLRVLATTLDLDPDWLAAVFSGNRLPLALTFDDAGWPVAVTGESRDDIAYQTAVDCMAEWIVAREQVPVQGPTPAVVRRGPAGAALPLLVSPTPAQVRKKARKARWRAAPWVASAVLALFNQAITMPAATHVTPVPGTQIATLQARSLASAPTGQFAALDYSSNSLFRIDSHGTAISTYRLPSAATRVYVYEDLTYVITQAPDGVLALRWNGASYTQAWSARVGALTVDLTRIGNELYLTQPAAGKIVALSASDGVRMGSAAVAPGVWSLVSYGDDLVVGDLSDDTLVWLKAVTLKPDGVTALDRSPAALQVAGSEILSLSIENSSITEITASSRKITGIRSFPRLNGTSAVSGMKIVAATYERQPRLLMIDIRTLQVTSSLVMPSEAYDLLLAQGSVVCNLPGNNRIIRLTMN
jgi:hypothetical protein